MFGFGSCGSWSISVRFGVWNILQWYFLFFFSGVGKANTDCFPQEVYCFPQEVSWAAAVKERRELNSENQSFLKLSVHVVYYEETHIPFFHWTQKAITTFPISFFWEGKTVPVPPVRFCTRFQRFTVPMVHKLFDFPRFGSTVPVRFQNLTDYSKLTFQMTKCLLSKALMVFATYAQETQFMQYSQSNGIGWEFAGRTGRNLQHCEEDRDGFPLAGVEVEVFFPDVGTTSATCAERVYKIRVVGFVSFALAMPL